MHNNPNLKALKRIKKDLNYTLTIAKVLLLLLLLHISTVLLSIMEQSYSPSNEVIEKKI
jgi:hypothetical protein